MKNNRDYCVRNTEPYIIIIIGRKNFDAKRVRTIRRGGTRADTVALIGDSGGRNNSRPAFGFRINFPT